MMSSICKAPIIGQYNYATYKGAIIYNILSLTYYDKELLKKRYLFIHYDLN